MSIPGILQQLAKSNPMMSQIKQMMSMVRSSQNPTAMLNQMAMNNPKLKNVMNCINQYGGDPQKAFYAMAEQNGVDPNEILGMLK